MPATRVHLSPDLLRALDERAEAEGISRNRLIVLALTRFVEERTSWPQGFIERLRTPLSKTDAEAWDRTMKEVRTRRTRKSAPDL